MTVVQILHPACTEYTVGFIPGWLSEHDPRPAKEQLHEAYAHGGGWFPMEGWTLNKDLSLSYPQDPDFAPMAMIRLRDERVVIYDCGFVAIIQTDGKFEVARMD